jgi:Glutathione S-transferase, N-terminal domain
MSRGETKAAGEAGQQVQNSALRLYEVVNQDGASVSPFVWRTKFALAKKELAYESVAVGYLDIPNIGSGTLKTVPILQSNDTFIVDSWLIAEWLDRTYPDHPAIFQSQSDIAMVRFFDKWFSTAVSSSMLRACIGALHDTLRLADRVISRRPENSAWARHSKRWRRRCWVVRGVESIAPSGTPSHMTSRLRGQGVYPDVIDYYIVSARVEGEERPLSGRGSQRTHCGDRCMRPTTGRLRFQPSRPAPSLPHQAPNERAENTGSRRSRSGRRFRR